MNPDGFRAFGSRLRKRFFVNREAIQPNQYQALVQGIVCLERLPKRGKRVTETLKEDYKQYDFRC